MGNDINNLVKIGHNGKVIIPVQVRRALNIEPGDFCRITHNGKQAELKVVLKNEDLTQIH